MSLISFTDTRVTYHRPHTEPTDAVRGVSLQVEPGELVTLVGESGSGKSTLVKAALGLLPRTARVHGEILLDGRNVAGWSQNTFAPLRGSYVGFIPQDPGVSLNPVKTVGRQIEDAVHAHERRGLSLSLTPGVVRGRARRAAARARALEALRLAGLPEPEAIHASHPHELSGGMKQRVLIAIALVGNPALLIADEPTSALDVTVQKQILDHLDLLRSELGIGVLMVTHDLGVALERSDRVVVMRHAEVVEHGTSADLLAGAREAYTRHLLDSAPGLLTERLTPRPIWATPGTPPPAPRPEGWAIEAQHLVKTYQPRGGGRAAGRGPVKAADDVSFRVRAGSTHALVGESGAGKSTVARLVAGLRAPDSGEVTLLGNPLPGGPGPGLRTRRELSRHLQFVYQNPYSSLDPRFSIADLVTEPLRVHRRELSRADRHAIAEDLLDGVRLPRSYAQRKAGELSGGQAQRVAIARALSLRPEIVILDEAVSALDVSVQAEILQLLTDLQAEHGLSYLFITHDLGVVKIFADTVTVMRQGRVVEDGTVDAVLSNPREEYTRGLVESVPGRGLHV